MDKYLSWTVYLFAVVGGDLTLAIYYALVVGWDGAPGIAGAFFCTGVGVIPTLASAGGNNKKFRAYNAVIAFGLAACCVFCGITAFRLIRGEHYKAAAVERSKERGSQVTQAVAEARAKGLRSRDAAEVGKAVASVVTSEAGAVQPAREELLREPVWFPYFPWVAGFLTAIFSTVLLARFWADEDRNADGVPDFLQASQYYPAPKAQPRPN